MRKYPDITPPPYQESGKYTDIIALPHWEPRSHTRMSAENRAAQFNSFKALTGYDDEVLETARQTDRRIELSEDDIREINDQLNYLQEHLNEHPQVKITYFVPDARKDGGAYQEVNGKVWKMDAYKRVLMIEGMEVQTSHPGTEESDTGRADKIHIPMDEICRISMG